MLSLGRSRPLHNTGAPQVALFVGSFGGALVEEFVTGREFTVLVVEEPVRWEEN